MEENILPEPIQIEETNEPKEHFEIWSNAQRSKNLIIAFWLMFGLTLLASVSDYYEIMLLKDMAAGEILSDEVITSSDTRQRVLAIIQMIGMVVSAILFICWFRRAYGNLDRIKQDPLHSESMAVWSFIIPIICLFRPVQMMYEIWNKTQDKIKELDSNYTIQPNRFSIGVWWFLFIISHFIGRYLMSAAFDDNKTMESIITLSQAYMVSDVLQVIEAFLVIVIINNMADIEAKLADEVNRNGGDVVFTS
ncbi:DUF4328 domain-containing protein [Flavobacterium terrisoli]|uniref:DUF4328 domain-containing protein n=1 Tax=Flavobacterium terrisoli TaxID=3242195 RepID=UPI002542A1D1|nr:DUF4328 domain-containing protein [Flavobacterium buctense]